MTNKQSFTPEEWSKVIEAVMAAGIAVTAAEPSGLWGTLKEAFSSATALTRAKTDAASGALIKSVVAEFETSEARGATQDALRKRFDGAKGDEVARRSIEALREAAAIVGAKAPDEAAAFKAWLRGIAQNVASAASEGGFLGFGGVKVSDKEKATLAEIDKVLA